MAQPAVQSALVQCVGATIPGAALGLLRRAELVYADRGVPLQAEPVPPVEELLVQAGAKVVLLLTADLRSPHSAALRAAGAAVIPAPPGHALLEAMSVMDRLRSPGGCPWDAEQTHSSLRQYLLEETYELLEAIEDGDRDAVREELGDVLLQVLFHARIAAEHETDPFTVDEVAEELVRKLLDRHPHVFSGADHSVHDAASQQRRWEELKQVEKQRESIVDGVALGQPALSLAAKLVARARRAGVPAELCAGGSGVQLFTLAADRKLDGVDPEAEVRAAARGFAATIRRAEAAARAEGIAPHRMTEAQWRACWPTAQHRE